MPTFIGKDAVEVTPLADAEKPFGRPEANTTEKESTPEERIEVIVAENTPTPEVLQNENKALIEQGAVAHEQQEALTINELIAQKREEHRQAARAYFDAKHDEQAKRRLQEADTTPDQAAGINVAIAQDRAEQILGRRQDQPVVAAPIENKAVESQPITDVVSTEEPENIAALYTELEAITKQQDAMHEALQAKQEEGSLIVENYNQVKRPELSVDIGTLQQRKKELQEKIEALKTKEGDTDTLPEGFVLHSEEKKVPPTVDLNDQDGDWVKYMAQREAAYLDKIRAEQLGVKVPDGALVSEVGPITTQLDGRGEILAPTRDLAFETTKLSQQEVSMPPSEAVVSTESVIPVTRDLKAEGIAIPDTLTDASTGERERYTTTKLPNLETVLEGHFDTTQLDKYNNIVKPTEDLNGVEAKNPWETNKLPTEESIMGTSGTAVSNESVIPATRDLKAEGIAIPDILPSEEQKERFTTNKLPTEAEVLTGAFNTTQNPELATSQGEGAVSKTFIDKEGNEQPKYSAAGVNAWGEQVYLPTAAFRKHQEEQAWEAHKEELRNRAAAVRGENESADLPPIIEEIPSHKDTGDLNKIDVTTVGNTDNLSPIFEAPATRDLKAEGIAIPDTLSTEESKEDVAKESEDQKEEIKETLAQRVARAKATLIKQGINPNENKYTDKEWQNKALEHRMVWRGLTQQAEDITKALGGDAAVIANLTKPGETSEQTQERLTRELQSVQEQIPEMYAVVEAAELMREMPLIEARSNYLNTEASFKQYMAENNGALVSQFIQTKFNNLFGKQRDIRVVREKMNWVDATIAQIEKNKTENQKAGEVVKPISPESIAKELAVQYGQRPDLMVDSPYFKKVVEMIKVKQAYNAERVKAMNAFREERMPAIEALPEEEYAAKMELNFQVFDKFVIEEHQLQQEHHIAAMEAQRGFLARKAIGAWQKYQGMSEKKKYAAAAGVGMALGLGVGVMTGGVGLTATALGGYVVQRMGRMVLARAAAKQGSKLGKGVLDAARSIKEKAVEKWTNEEVHTTEEEKENLKYKFHFDIGEDVGISGEDMLKHIETRNTEYLKVLATEQKIKRNDNIARFLGAVTAGGLTYGLTNITIGQVTDTNMLNNKVYAQGNESPFPKQQEVPKIIEKLTETPKPTPVVEGTPTTPVKVEAPVDVQETVPVKVNNVEAPTEATPESIKQDLGVQVGEGGSIWKSVREQMRAYAEDTTADHNKLGIKESEMPAFKTLQEELVQDKPLSPESARLLDRLTGRAIVANQMMNKGMTSGSDVVVWDPDTQKIYTSANSTYDMPPKAVRIEDLGDTKPRVSYTGGIEESPTKPKVVIQDRIAKPEDIETAPITEQAPTVLKTSIESPAATDWRSGLTPEQVKFSEGTFNQIEQNFGGPINTEPGTVGALPMNKFMELDPKAPITQEMKVTVVESNGVSKEVIVPRQYRMARYMVDQMPDTKPTPEELTNKTGDVIRTKLAIRGDKPIEFTPPVPKPEEVPNPTREPMSSVQPEPAKIRPNTTYEVSTEDPK